MKNKLFLLPVLIASISLATNASADNDEQRSCQTKVVLQNMLTNNVSASNPLIVNLDTGNYPTWAPIWSNTSLAGTQSLTATMSYPYQRGNPAQFNAQFSIHDSQGHQCTFAPWLITKCDVVWNWNCSADSNFKPVFWHVKHSAASIDTSPWLISLQNN